ncbi:MAG: hypothetical protein QOG87_811 [Actinomycetota bacterium]|jgi:hypothetical protein
MRSTIIGVVLAIALGVGAGVVIGQSGDDNKETALRARAVSSTTSTTELEETTTSSTETSTTLVEELVTDEVAAAPNAFSTRKHSISAKKKSTGAGTRPAAARPGTGSSGTTRTTARPAPPAGPTTTGAQSGTHQCLDPSSQFYSLPACQTYRDNRGGGGPTTTAGGGPTTTAGGGGGTTTTEFDDGQPD